MIIEGQGGAPLTEVQLQILIGDQVMNFKHYIPTVGPNGYTYAPAPVKCAITFADSREIDSFIIMLEKFRKDVLGHMGSWVKTPLVNIQPWDSRDLETVLGKLVEKEVP